MIAWLLSKLFSTSNLAKALTLKGDVMSVNILTSKMIEELSLEDRFTPNHDHKESANAFH